MKPFRLRPGRRVSRVSRATFLSLTCASVVNLFIGWGIFLSPVAAQVTAASASPSISMGSTVGIAPGLPFVYLIQASNSPVTYAAAGLPRGLTCDSVTGAITGVTAEFGRYSVALRATNSSGTGVAVQEMIVEGVTPIEMPLVRSVTPIAPGQYRTGDTLTIVVEIDAPYGELEVSGTPRIALSIGTATRFASYQSVESGSTTRPRVTFNYVVSPEDEAASTIIVANAIELNGGSIRDRKGLYCTLGLPDVHLADVRIVKVQSRSNSEARKPGTLMASGF